MRRSLTRLRRSLTHMRRSLTRLRRRLARLPKSRLPLEGCCMPLPERRLRLLPGRDRSRPASRLTEKSAAPPGRSRPRPARASRQLRESRLHLTPDDLHALAKGIRFPFGPCPRAPPSSGRAPPSPLSPPTLEGLSGIAQTGLDLRLSPSDRRRRGVRPAGGYAKSGRPGSGWQ
jgi:hypothetical protein